MELLSAERHMELVDGLEVFRDQAHTTDDPDSPVQTRTSVTFAVVFGDGTEVAGEPVGPVVRGLVQHARDSVEPLVALVRDQAPLPLA